MRRITSFLMQVMPLVSTVLVLSLTASAAHAGAVSCGAEQSSGATPYTTVYEIPKDSTCTVVFATVFAYKDCIDQYGNACRISWQENYAIYYDYFTLPEWWWADCYLAGSFLYSNTNVVDPCQ